MILEVEKPKLEPVISLVKIDGKDGSTENETPLSPPQLTPQVHVAPPVIPPTSSHIKTQSKSKPLRNRSSNGVISTTAIPNIISPTTNNVVSSVTSPSPKVEIDLDKHCGVETDGVQCAQLLSCKLHTLAMKQEVKGRSRKLEVFLPEHVSEKETVKKKKEIKVVKATPDSTTPLIAPFPTPKVEVTQKSVLEAAKKFTPIVSSPPALSSAPVIPSPVSLSIY